MMYEKNLCNMFYNTFSNNLGIFCFLQINQPAYFSDESDDDIPDELKHEYVDESDHTRANKKKCKFKQSGPMVTNTTLSILRVCGKYLQMSRLLRSIAVTVIQSMIQFFE